MRKTLFIVILMMTSFLAFSYSSTKTLIQTGSIEGRVRDSRTLEPVIMATIHLYNVVSGIRLITGTDFTGHYEFENIEIGTYTLEVSYVGYGNHIEESITVENGRITPLDLELTEHVCLDAIEIVAYKEPSIEFDNTTQGSVLSSEPKKKSLRHKAEKHRQLRRKEKMSKGSIESLPSKSLKSITTSSAGEAVSSKGEVSILSSRANSTFYYIDGVRVAIGNITVMLPSASITKLGDAAVVQSKAEKEGFCKVTKDNSLSHFENEDNYNLPESGLLTVAEWNPLTNWEEWKELQVYSDYSIMQNYWELPIHRRYSVFVTNASGLAAANEPVKLLSTENETLWEARTDNSGKAELWLSEDSKATVSSITVGEGRSIYTIDSPKEIFEGCNYLSIPKQCIRNKAIDIMWVVDATSSMADEINYLKAELSDVADRVAKDLDENYEDMALRMGAVFYKDIGDAYLTKVHPLESDLGKITDFISERSATGGGFDLPEILDDALDEALAQGFDPNASTKLMFVVLDAPPRHNDEVLVRLKIQAMKAAALGIKIIPVTASGIDRETEYLMKQLAILTNGTYVFLTDDSCIGDPHLEPLASDYEVETLNDLLVRLVTNYSQHESCAIKTDDDTLKIKAYPNPTTSSFTVDYKGRFDRMILTTVTGKIIESYSYFESRKLIDLSQYLPGVYYVKVISGDLIKSVAQVIKV